MLIFSILYFQRELLFVNVKVTVGIALETFLSCCFLNKAYSCPHAVEGHPDGTKSLILAKIYYDTTVFKLRNEDNTPLTGFLA